MVSPVGWGWPHRLYYNHSQKNSVAQLPKEVFMRPQPLIAVTDVAASSRWYQHLLGCKSDHGGPNYERLVHDAELILQLHHFDVEDHHGPIGNRRHKTYGDGVLL